jgi:hypothetical protein
MAKPTAFCAVIGCSKPAADKHHIGGQSSPMIWVCKECHARIHGISWEADHGKLVKAGLERARKEGRIGGNPRLRPGAEGRDEIIRAAAAGKKAAHKAAVLASYHAWFPIVQDMRPHKPWTMVARAVRPIMGKATSTAKLQRKVKILVDAGIADPALMKRTPRTLHHADHTKQLTRYISRLRAMKPQPSLRQIASQLEAMGIHTPRGKERWPSSSVAYLLDRAK